MVGDEVDDLSTGGGGCHGGALCRSQPGARPRRCARGLVLLLAATVAAGSNVAAPPVRRGPSRRRLYDGGVGQFAPDGTLYQVEYAMKAVERSEPVVAAVVRGGGGGGGDGGAAVGIAVVARVKRRISERLRADGGALETLHQIDEHIVCAAAGVTPDVLAIVSKAREEGARHRAAFGEPMPVRLMVRQVANHLQAYTQHGGLRPFGIGLVVAGFDSDEGFQVFEMDPSGNFVRRAVAAAGAGAPKLREEVASALAGVAVGAADEGGSRAKEGTDGVAAGESPDGGSSQLLEGASVVARALSPTSPSEGRGEDEGSGSAAALELALVVVRHQGTPSRPIGKVLIAPSAKELRRATTRK